MKNNKLSSIAIIDSGIGGISILKQLINKYKSGHYVYFADNLFMPYGNKDKEFVKNRVIEIINFLKTNYNVNEIVIACNTASSCLKDSLDNDVKILTFEYGKTYLTTKLTKDNLVGFNAIEARNLASNIERYIFNKTKMDKIVKNTIDELKLNSVSNLVLGCTHYELVADLFKKHCPKSKIELNSAKIIESINISKDEELKLTIIMSKKTSKYKNKILKLLKV